MRSITDMVVRTFPKQEFSQTFKEIPFMKTYFIPQNCLFKSFVLIGLCFVLGCPGEVPQPADPPKKDSTSDKKSADSGEQKELKRLIILTNGNSAYWDTCRTGMQDGESELNIEKAGFKAEFLTNDGTPDGQLKWLRQFSSLSDVAGIAICVTDAANIAIAEEMKKLQEKGIKVITVDSDVDRDQFRDSRYAFIGTDNTAAGNELGLCAKNILPDGGGYVAFVGRTGAQNAIERMDGFAETAGNQFKELDRMEDGMDRSRAKENVRNAIQNHGDQLKMLVGIYSYNAPAIVDVEKENESKDSRITVAFDAEPGTISELKAGKIDAAVVQNPYQMGYQSIRMLKALIEDDKKVLSEMLPSFGEEEGDLFDTGLKVVVPNDNKTIKADMFKKKTEFLKFDAFEKWLNEHDLTCS